tara:strand:- start:434 stop:568 length:135 start_codon:yes stop_codon:yes gene_type:complete
LVHLVDQVEVVEIHMESVEQEIHLQFQFLKVFKDMLAELQQLTV